MKISNTRFRRNKLFLGSLTLAFLLVLSFVPSLTAAHIQASNVTQGESLMIDRSNADPNFDPWESLGADVIEALNSASKNAIVENNLETGTISIYENVNSRTLSVSTEPYIPEGLEIAIPEIGFTPFAIIGSDNRSEITNVNAYPYCAIAYLEITYADGTKGTGSGAFVGDKAILTAGHVVHHQTYGKATSIKVKPGGVNSSFSTITASSTVTVSGWVNDTNWEYDYGMIKLSSSPNTGNFGTRAESDSNLNSKNIYCYGYPGDKTSGTLWYDTGSIGTVNTRRFQHNADTFGGNSGGPISLTSDYLYIVGVHSDKYSSSYNIATRVTSDVVNFVANNK